MRTVGLDSIETNSDDLFCEGAILFCDGNYLKIEVFKLLRGLPTVSSKIVCGKATVHLVD